MKHGTGILDSLHQYEIGWFIRLRINHPEPLWLQVAAEQDQHHRKHLRSRINQEQLTLSFQDPESSIEESFQCIG